MVSSAAQRRQCGAVAGWSWCLLLAVAVLAVAVQAAAAGGPAFYPSGRYGKRVETEGPMLPAGRGGWASGRIGRSGPPLPRADRFFMGSRYGKRAGGESALAELAPQLTQAQAEAARHRSPPAGAFVALPDMWAVPDLALDRALASLHGSSERPPVPSACVYTGIADFYRCSSVREKVESQHELDAQAELDAQTERDDSASDTSANTAPAAQRD